MQLPPLGEKELTMDTLEVKDTICAISTPPGVGGIAVARISGHQSIEVAQRIWQGRSLAELPTHRASLGTVLDDQGAPLDQAVATVFRSPGSFTGEDVVELSVHGSRYVQQALIASLISAGARLAEAGEFTRRAFSSGRMDLAQAEAVADIIASESKAAHRIAMTQMRGRFSERLRSLRDRLVDLSCLLELELDFSEEDVEFADRAQLLSLATEIKTEVDRLAASFRSGQAIKNGIPVAIIGPTNAGKSSLLNALLGDDRAIVSDIHGTTRDVVEDTIYISDYQFRLMDTAGLRSTTDAIESIGIDRSRRAAERARIIIYVVDSTNPQPIDLPPTDAHILIALNKSDLVAQAPSPAPESNPSVVGQAPSPAIPISAKTGSGLDALKSALAALASEAESGQESVLVTNERHYQALTAASESITRAIAGMSSGLSGELIAQDTRLTIAHLSSILGDIPSSEILSTVFSRFCIGK